MRRGWCPFLSAKTGLAIGRAARGGAIPGWVAMGPVPARPGRPHGPGGGLAGVGGILAVDAEELPGTLDAGRNGQLLAGQPSDQRVHLAIGRDRIRAWRGELGVVGLLPVDGYLGQSRA